MKQIRMATTEFCPFCGKEMASQAHVELCGEARSFRMDGLYLHMNMYKDEDDDLWVSYYDTMTGDIRLLPVNEQTIPIIYGKLQHFAKWLTMPMEDLQ